MAYADWVKDNPNLQWKANRAAVCVAPFATSTALVKTDVFDATTGDLKALPTGWLHLGTMTEDMVNWSREVEMSEIRSGGYADPTRRDPKSSTKSFTVTAQETNRATVQLVKGMDLSSLTADSKFTVEITEPDLPSIIYWRVLVVGLDNGRAAGAGYRARTFTRASVEVGDETWNNEDNAMETEFTFTALKDATASVGYATREWIKFSNAAEVTASGFTAGT